MKSIEDFLGGQKRLTELLHEHPSPNAKSRSEAQASEPLIVDKEGNEERRYDGRGTDEGKGNSQRTISYRHSGSGGSSVPQVVVSGDGGTYSSSLLKPPSSLSPAPSSVDTEGEGNDIGLENLIVMIVEDEPPCQVIAKRIIREFRRPTSMT